MTTKIPTHNLSIIDNLYKTKEQELKQIVGNLQLSDVKEDGAFEATVKRIKKQILFTPVEFGEPSIAHHNSTTRQVEPNYQQMWGGTQEVLIVTVEFSFTGSTELFSAMPSNVGLSMGNVFQPYGSPISVEVTLTKLDKNAAIQEAKQQMATTFAVIEANNKQATTWSTSKEAIIDSLLEQKRKEIIDFYS